MEDKEVRTEYDVFISYAREDSRFCDAIDTVLRQFALETFVDRRALDPGHWPSQLEATLRSPSTPTVVILASRAAARSNWIRREFNLAVDRDLPILVLQLERNAVQRLGWSEYQMIDLSDQQPERLDNRARDELWLALHRKIVKDKVPQFRREATNWCTELLPEGRIDFWKDEWQGYLLRHDDASRHYALTAQGGSGKSVLVAHLVEHLLASDPRSCPIIIPLDILRRGEDAVSQFIGARSRGVLIEHMNRVQRELEYKVLFVVDGLDRLPPSSSPGDYSRILNLLAAASSLVVTCRTEFWEREFYEANVAQIPVAELQPRAVDRILQQTTSFRGIHIPLLRIPFYLDAVLQFQHRFIDLPSTRTDILGTIWEAYSEGIQRPEPAQDASRRILQRLAEFQLDAMTFEISRVDLELACRAEGISLRSLADLEELGRIRRRTISGRVYVRLPHDLLDSFGMTELMVNDTAQDLQRRMTVYERADEDCGSHLLSMLIQIAHDTEDLGLKREVFSHLLAMLDRKQFGDKWMAMAWAATYVLREHFLLFCPLILECLEGRPIESLAMAEASTASRLGPGAQVTQEAASSLASVFAALSPDNWPSAEPDRAIPVLERGLYQWKNRRRFVEALAKYRTQASRKALEEFAVTELATGRDPEVLAEVAEALAAVGGRSSIRILQDIISRPDVNPRTRRIAIIGKNALARSRDPVPEIEEQEIIENLRPIDSRGRYSDWRTIQEYADYAMRRIVEGRLSPALLEALINALRHAHTYARRPVIACLGRTDDPIARAALLSEVLEPQVPSEVRRACVAALREHLRQAPTLAIRQARRWFVADAARQAQRAFSYVVSQDLDALASEPDIDTGLLIVGDAFEAVPAPRDGLGPRCTFAMVASSTAPINPDARAIVERRDRRAVGPGREPKYRICEIAGSENDTLLVRVTEDTWENGASFHRAMRRKAREQWGRTNRLLEQWLSLGSYLPNIAVVHCTILTKDGKIVLARRSKDAFYASNQWSASFEEQITTSDLHSSSGNPVSAAAIRGFQEEFGVAAGESDCTVRLLSTIIEMPILNPGLVVVIESQETLAEIQQIWSDRRSRASQPEVTELEGLDATTERLQAVIHGEEPWEFHPTSAIRLAMVTTLLR
jgi:hypothetical protein